jgi:hypothetical protein
VFRTGIWTNNRLLKTAAFIIMILLTIETLHGLYFTGKIMIDDKAYFHPDKDYILQKDFIKELVKKHKQSSRHLVFTGAEKPI